jgi:hypothetical protein
MGQMTCDCGIEFWDRDAAVKALDLLAREDSELPPYAVASVKNVVRAEVHFVLGTWEDMDRLEAACRAIGGRYVWP